MSLKDGIDLRKLLDGEGVSFEVDPSKTPSRGVWENQPYTNEELFQQLNSECALPEDDSDEDNDAVS